jgi:hypothetical protein
MQPCMENMFDRLNGVAEALLRIFAVALGEHATFFEDKVDRHHSNMQVANYSSLLLWPEGPDACMRKKAHLDSGTVTILSSDDWLSDDWQVRGCPACSRLMYVSPHQPCQCALSPWRPLSEGLHGMVLHSLGVRPDRDMNKRSRVF